MTNGSDEMDKELAWRWVQRITPLLIVPTLGVSLVTWADFRTHMTNEPAHQRLHEDVERFMSLGERWTQTDALRQEASIKSWVENKFPSSLQYTYLVERINELQGDIAEIKALIKEK